MLTRNQIIDNLTKLGEELERQGLEGEVILTGGASMCLIHSARDMTKDIDALYEPKSDINMLVKKIAAENGLPMDWLNDSVKGFVNENLETVMFLRLGALNVSTVTPEYLLAMKLMSARATGQDYNDIKYLFQKLNITSFKQAEEIVDRFYPMRQILPKTMYIIEQSLQEILDQDEYER